MTFYPTSADTEAGQEPGAAPVEPEVIASPMSPNHDAVSGRFVKGNNANRKGRVKGRRNNATIAKLDAAKTVLQRAGQRAAERVLRGLDDPNPWLALAAARIVLEHALPPGQEPPDVEWLSYATEGEIAGLARLIKRCKGRMPINDGHIDVTPERASLPASGEPQPESTVETPQPENDDAEEFDAS